MSRPYKNLTGMTFGLLTVKEYYGKSTWLVTCACGSEPFLVHRSNLTLGRTKTCGCKNPDQKRVQKNLEIAVLDNSSVQYNFWVQVKRDVDVFVGLCICGRQFTVKTLEPNLVLSCGCLKPGSDRWPTEIFAYPKTKHPLYRKWLVIMRNAKTLGIEVDPLWAEDYIWFLGWAVSHWSYKDLQAHRGRLYLWRRDLFLGFTPDNCYFSAHKQTWTKKRPSQNL